MGKQTFNSPVYSNFNYNCLVEMLSLDEKQLLLVDENTTVKEIRNIKKDSKKEELPVEEIPVDEIDPLSEDEPIKINDVSEFEPYLNDKQLSLIAFIINNEINNISEKYQGLFEKSNKLKKIYKNLYKRDKITD